MPTEAARPGFELPMWGRAAVFFAVIAVLGWFTNIAPGRKSVVEPITHLSVLATGALVRVFGGDVSTVGTVLYGDDAVLNVKDGCNGVIAMILFTGALIAHRASPGAKVLGLLLGLPAIWIVNVVRLVTLWIVSAVSPANLEFFHVYFWQTLIIICVGVLWYHWATWSLRRDLRASRAASPATVAGGIDPSAAQRP